MSGAQVRVRRRLPVDHSWLIVLGVIVVMTFGGGMPWYAMGIFFSPLVEDFHWGRGAYSLATSTYTVLITLGSAPVGRLVDRWGSRRVMWVAALASGLTWGLISQIGRIGHGAPIWQLYPAYGLLGLASSGLGGVPSSALIARWFSRRRGLAMGLSAIGGSLPGVILVPLSAPLIAAYGWRLLALFFGALVVVGTLPFIHWALRDPPAAGQEAQCNDPKGAVPEVTARQALRMAAFWVVGGALLLTMAGSGAVQMHALPFLMDRGLSRASASNVWGFLAFTAVLGKIGLGWAADRYSARAVFLVSLGLMAASVSVALASPSATAAWLFALIFGLGMGGMNCSRALLTAEYFGIRAYGTISGLLTLFMLPGTGGGQPLAGYIYDLTGSYRTAYSLFVGAWLVAMVAVLLLGRPHGGPQPSTNARREGKAA